MRRIVYYVASSLDGFISGINGDTSRFVMGKGIDQYFKDLETYDTSIMGRGTYEFGYKFGLKAGENPYPSMKTYIFSNTLNLKNPSESLFVVPIDIDTISKLQDQDGSDIYLCGGGKFAGWLLAHKKIDVLKLKLNPILLGNGVRLFGEKIIPYNLELTMCNEYENGLLINEYKIIY